MPAHLDPLHGKEPADFSQASCLERFAAQKARWLVIRRFKEWDEKEREELATIRQASETAETLSLLVQQFFQLLRKWQGDRLDAWLTAVAPSQIEERQRFAHGREQEKAAVLMGLTHSPPMGKHKGRGPEYNA